MIDSLHMGQLSSIGGFDKTMVPACDAWSLLPQVALVAMNIIGDPVGCTDESNIVSLEASSLKKQLSFQKEGGVYCRHKGCRGKTRRSDGGVT